MGAPDSRTGGLVTALGIGQICSWGSLFYSFPLIAEAMGAEFGWSRTDLYGAASVGLILAALAAYPAGVAVDRGYGRWLMGLSSLGAGALLIFWSQVNTILTFYLCVAGIGVLQAATLYEPAFAVIARRVGPLQSRRAITALTLWGGFASTVFVPLVQVLLDHWGWRDALVVLGLVNIFVCAVMYLSFIRPELDTHINTDVAVDERTRINKSAVRTALRRPVFWMLLLSLTAHAAMFSSFTFHMYPLLIERGIQTVAVVQAIALIGPAQVIGRILISLFARTVSMRIIGSVVVASLPVTFGALLLVKPDFGTVAFLCMTYGAANGVFTIVRGLVVPEMLSQHAYGAINGILTVPATLARAAAPVGAALIWSATGSYDEVLVAITVCALILAASFWFAAWLSR